VSRTRINDKWLSNCTGEELRQMNRLRFKGDSMMYEDIILAPYHRDKIRIFLLKKDGVTVAWSGVITPISRAVRRKKPDYPTRGGTKYSPIYTYVSQAHRKSGFGKRLLRATANYSKSKRYIPVAFWYDKKSNAFFVKAKQHIPHLRIFDISKWWDLI